MKGDFSILILELIQFSVSTAADILDAMTYYGYSSSYKRMRGLSVKISKYKPVLQTTLNQLKERQRVSKLLYKLKTDGLIKENIKTGKTILEITNKGKDKFKQLKDNRSVKPEYKMIQANDLKIIIFDIPESERFKRQWLRDALKVLGFTMLQKSVWAGKVVLPEEFFNDLHKQNLLQFVEIFAVTKSGTLKPLN